MVTTISSPEVKTEDKSITRDEFFKRMNTMFNHQSKLSKLVDPVRISNYKEVYFYLFEKVQSGELPILKDYFGGNDLAENIYKRKYFLKDLDNKLIEEKPEDVYMRLASYMASVEETQELREKFAVRFYLDLFNGYYLPGGRVIAGAGDLYRLKTLANCFVSQIENDSLEGIYKASYEAARTYSFGGGIGIDISQLRPRDSRVHNAADSSTGSVSFMELYSLTTGLIGQSGRRGALMLTIDIKHPDIMDFINVKKDPNWATNQILERLKGSGQFNEAQLEEAKKNIVENTQVRFANISIKVSDEFMAAVEEQNLYGTDKILVYSKSKTGPEPILSSDETNYSYGMSKKDPKKYQLIETFNNVEELNAYLIEHSVPQIREEYLADINNRDYYGDFVLESESLSHDLAIRYSGDFMTCYKSKTVGEIKELHKARDIWNSFIEGNYKTAEPGLIFWSEMTKYSPSNYVGLPISCTNPCFAADNYVQTLEGPRQIGDVIDEELDIVVDDKVVSTKGFFKTGTKEVFEVKTKEGFKINLTDNHPLRRVSENGDLSWVEVKDIKKGDKIKLQEHNLLTWGGRGNRDEGFLLGMLVGDGTFSDGMARLSVWKDEVLKQRVLSIIKPYMKSDSFEGWDDSSYEGKWNIKSKHLSNLAQEYEVIPKVKEITKAIETASSEFQIGFLKGLFSADGYVLFNESKGHRYVRLSQLDLPRLESVQRMLARLGIFSKIYKRRDESKVTFPNNQGVFYDTKTQYELSITKQSLVRFYDRVGFEGYKKDQLREVVESFGSRGPHKDNWSVEIDSITLKSTEDVYDIQVPGENRLDINGFDAHNCGEVPLEKGGACNLGSVNLSRMVKNGYTNEATVNWELLGKTTSNLTRFLDNVVWWNETLNALEIQRDAARNTRRLGLGVMGIADMFNQLGLDYDSEEAITLLEKVMSHITQHAYKTSALLAKEKGQAPAYKDTYLENPFYKEILSEDVKELIRENGVRNIAILSIAPTGTISNAITGFRTEKKNYIGISGGIEPIFALFYTRRSEQMHQGGIYNVFHNTVQAYIDVKGLTQDAAGADDDKLRQLLPSYFFRTAHYINPDLRIKIQGIAQKYVDHSISSTINLSEDIDPETISDIYLKAWKNRLKGVTIYRDGSRFPILSVKGQETPFQEFKDKRFRIVEGDKEIIVKGNDVLVTATGRLTTVYHGKTRGLF